MNNEISITIVEDDFLLAYRLKKFFEEQNMVVDDIYNTGEDFIKNISNFNSNLAILDITLRGQITGLDLGDRIRKQFPQCSLVFLTGNFDEQTTKRIVEIEPTCYIRKPYDESTLLVNINIALSKLSKSSKKLEEHKISVQDGKKSYYLNINEILYLMSDGNYLKIYLLNGENLLIRQKLSDFSVSNDFKHFIRTHVRYLVNPKHIFHYSYRMLIVGNNEIPISEKYRPKLKEVFN